MNTQSPAAPAQGARRRHASVLNTLIKEVPDVFVPLKIGDVVEGGLIKKGSRLILIDLGRYGVGAVYGSEVLAAREMVRPLKPGDTITGKVVDVDNEDDYIELSITEAGAQKSWEEIAVLAGKDEPIEVILSGYNKGGLIADVAGLQAFLPLSQLGPLHYPKVENGDVLKITQALQKLLKEKLTVKIIDVNQRQGKVIISERAALQESNKELAAQYHVGDIVPGIISGVADFGAFFRFTDNPALEGLIHLSELSHVLVDSPKEAIRIDEAVTAKIIEIKDGKIYLSRKALQEDPWARADELYKKNDEVKGNVQSFTPFGAIVSLGDLQGYLHITEFGSMEEMRKHLQPNEEHTFVIREVKPEEKRIYLTLKG